jgi:predicted HTH domain antitoxin
MLQPMTTLSIPFPEDVFAALRLSPDETAREMRLVAAIHWYCQGAISQEKAARVAGLDRPDFIRELGKREMPAFHVDLEDLKKEALRD